MMRLQTRLIRHCYTLLFSLALPFIFLRLLLRSYRLPAYRQRLAERLGFVTRATQPSIWIHTVSVGETLAAIPLIHALLAAFPEYRIWVTTTTPTGSEQVQLKLGTQVSHSYLPYDLPHCIRRFLDRSQATLCILLETEVWPNLLYTCQQQRVPTLLANARLSEKSMRGYQRLGILATDLFTLFTQIAAQNVLDAEHYKMLGMPPEKITVTGSIKFDYRPPPDIAQQGHTLRQSWQADQRPVWIAASTRDGEAPLIIAAHQQLLAQYPDLLLVIAPRHPERFDSVFAYCQQQGLQTHRKSSATPVTPETQVIVADTLGELLRLYATADIAYVGGSLVPVGGHNLLEPAILGKPILTGPSLRNFKVISGWLQDAGALIIVHSPDHLAQQIKALLTDTNARQQMGEHAKQVIAKNVGAVDRQMTVIRNIMAERTR